MKGSVAPEGDCAPASTDSLVPSTADSAIALASYAQIETHACRPGLLSWLCEPRSGVGGDCFTDINCQDGLYCDNPDLSLGSHECLERKSGGESCQNPNECVSMACKGGICADGGDVQATYCLL